VPIYTSTNNTHPQAHSHTSLGLDLIYVSLILHTAAVSPLLFKMSIKSTGFRNEKSRVRGSDARGSSGRDGRPGGGRGRGSVRAQEQVELRVPADDASWFQSAWRLSGHKETSRFDAQPYLVFFSLILCFLNPSWTLRMVSIFQRTNETTGRCNRRTNKNCSWKLGRATLTDCELVFYEQRYPAVPGELLEVCDELTANNGLASVGETALLVNVLR